MAGFFPSLWYGYGVWSSKLMALRNLPASYESQERSALKKACMFAEVLDAHFYFYFYF